MNRSLLRSLRRTLSAQNQMGSLGVASGGGYYPRTATLEPATTGITAPAFDAEALRDELQQQVERERDNLAAELLKIRAENPEANLPEEAIACGIAATRIYPDLPADESGDNEVLPDYRADEGSGTGGGEALRDCRLEVEQLEGDNAILSRDNKALLLEVQQLRSRVKLIIPPAIAKTIRLLPGWREIPVPGGRAGQFSQLKTLTAWVGEEARKRSA